MKTIVNHRQLSIISAALAGCILLSSCSLLGGNKAPAAIKKTVAAYLDSIQDGSFTDDEYVSDYADDSAFADLEFADEAVRAIMDKALTRIEYTIDAASGDVKTEEGACDVTVTAIDVKEVLSGLEDKTLDADTLMKAIKDKEAPTKDYEITLDMTYDSSGKSWLVADSTPLTEILGDPYTEISFGPAAGSPAALIDTFMKALGVGDADTIDIISPYLDSTNFFDPDENVMKMATLFYSKIEYSVDGEPAVTDNSAEANVKMSIPDIATIVNEVSNDSEFMATVLKPYILASINSEDTTALEAEATKVIIGEVISRLNASDVPMLSVDSVFKMEQNQDTKKWELSEIPSELYNIDTSPTTSDESYMASATLAMDMLLQDGSIDQATYDQFMASLNGTTQPTNTSVSNDGSSPASDISFSGWYDSYTMEYVSSYDSATTTVIELDIEFNTVWTDLVLNYEYYNENGTILIKSATAVAESDGYSYYMPLDMNDGSTIPADTYVIIVTQEDGTPITQNQVTVS